MIRDRLRSALARLVPASLRRARRDRILRNRWKSLEALPPRELFQSVYASGLWGSAADPEEAFYSGSGSHHASFVESYHDAVTRYVGTLSAPLDAVDLGCGDFAIGSRLRNMFARYVACDVVEPLIARNRERFASLDVDFRVLDITADALPPGDVVIMRQVLQHLSNPQILAAVAQIPAIYKVLILSEHVPASGEFVPNLDKPSGPHTRLDYGGPASGVILTEPPFNLKAKSSLVLCEARDYLGVIRTTAYEF